MNDTDDERLMILERTAWSDQAATAAEVFNLQAFRDLFSNEALRSGEQISVGSLTILFTDLVDSTRLYREIGDAPAFDLVLDHFSVLQDVVQDEEGVIVKTIGDAVMASFRRPVDALRAIRAAQQRLAHLTAGGKHLCLKAGVHQGPSIAVTLNEKLDYFGTTINIAARLEKLSLGDDLIISAAVMADHEVQEYLDTEPTLKVTPFTRTLKGFDEEDFQLWRISI
jgi:class 3 adenylate cyclase